MYNQGEAGLQRAAAADADHGAVVRLLVEKLVEKEADVLIRE